MDFSKFDAMAANVQAQYEEAAKNQYNNEEAPAGWYIVNIEKLEIKATKSDQMPMLSAMFRIVDSFNGKNKNRCLFFNRKIAGTKNDGNMVRSAIGWLNSLEPSVPIDGFTTYTALNQQVEDMADELIGVVQYKIQYDSTKFNNISIEEAYDL